jgi:hypothetical protein
MYGWQPFSKFSYLFCLLYYINIVVIIIVKVLNYSYPIFLSNYLPTVQRKDLDSECPSILNIKREMFFFSFCLGKGSQPELKHGNVEKSFNWIALSKKPESEQPWGLLFRELL